MPAKRGGAEASRLLGEDQEGELEGLGEADVLELGSGGPGGEEVPVVQRAAKSAVGTRDGHGNTCSHECRLGATDPRLLAGFYVPRPAIKRAELSPCAVGTVDHDFFVTFVVRVADEESLPAARVLVTRSLPALDALEGALDLPHELALPIAGLR